jgi:transcriptional regulator with XRE-family HTH domain
MMLATVEDVGSRLRTIRRARAYTQRDLQKRSGVAASTIANIEHGKHEPQPRTIRKLASALGVSPERLMVGEDL